MFRYLAVMWAGNEEFDQEEANRLTCKIRETSIEWRVAVSNPGLIVLYAGARARSNAAYILQGGLGVVLGKLFERPTNDAASAAPEFAEGESLRIVDSGGQFLIENYWGRYVAFAHDQKTGCSWVLRDPTGGLPCYTAKHNRLTICFSRIEDCEQLGLFAFRVNWDYVEAKLLFGRAYGSKTGVEGVSEILPGHRITADCERRAAVCWDPMIVASTDAIEDPDKAADLLASTTKACVHAWASCYDGILLRLSGGLDSSIVLGCLKHAPNQPRIVGLNYYSRGSDSDERYFARLAARRSGVRLIEQERNSSLRLERMLAVSRSVVPHFYFAYVENGRYESALAHETDSSAIWTGGGGDQLFYQAEARLAAADYLQLHGLTKNLVRIALDSARLERDSIWRVLSEAIRRGVFGQHWSPLEAPGRNRTLIPADLVRKITKSEAAEYTYSSPPAGATSGKLFQVDTLSIPPRFYDPTGRADDPEPLEPLVNSQPVQEVCLRIPTYIHIHGGVDRGIARRAFTKDLPPEIRGRRTKGGLEEHAKVVLARNVQFTRELLLGGVLAERKLIDVVKLEEFLSGRPSSLAANMAELYDVMSLEAWLRVWTHPPLRRVA